MRLSGHFLRFPGPAVPGMRIGLLGGSFNPAHGGHVYISEVALKRLGLDAVWWLVSPGNPLKSASGMASFTRRMDRARDVARHPRIFVSDLEAQLGTVFTVDTVRALTRRLPSIGLVWLMGSDNLMQFDRWRRWKELAAMVPVAVVMRPGSELAPLKARAMPYFRMRPGRLFLLDGRRNEESATALRAGGHWPLVPGSRT